MMKKFISFVTAAFLFALFVLPVGAADDAMVRVIHASPDAPAVDIAVDGETAVSGAEFKAVTDYLTLPAGEHKVEVFAAGTTEDPVLSQTLNIEAGKFYSVAAIGKLADIELAVMEDNGQGEDGKSMVRVAHFAPDAPAVDVAPKGGDALFSDLEFSKVSDYGTLDAGTYDLEVRPAGAMDVVKALDGIKLDSGKNYTALAIGLLEGEPAFDVLLIPDGGEMAAMPDTGLGGSADTSSMATTWALVALAGVALVGTSYVIRRKQNA
ncbi:Peptidase [Exiguobacterium oxidotolerans]|uniref:Peptidase n=2 Tax=Exiguobacterium oxidotolerans TaxID=223958 RepID=A0A653IGF1_9BACL|nr:Peptidase [Exiguobacterium oxidotolerans]